MPKAMVLPTLLVMCYVLQKQSQLFHDVVREQGQQVLYERPEIMPAFNTDQNSYDRHDNTNSATLGCW